MAFRQDFKNPISRRLYCKLALFRSSGVICELHILSGRLIKLPICIIGCWIVSQTKQALEPEIPVFFHISIVHNLVLFWVTFGEALVFHQFRKKIEGMEFFRIYKDELDNRDLFAVHCQIFLLVSWFAQ